MPFVQHGRSAVATKVRISTCIALRMKRQKNLDPKRNTYIVHLWSLCVCCAQQHPTKHPEVWPSRRCWQWSFQHKGAMSAKHRGSSHKPRRWGQIVLGEVGHPSCHLLDMFGMSSLQQWSGNHTGVAISQCCEIIGQRVFVFARGHSLTQLL